MTKLRTRLWQLPLKGEDLRYVGPHMNHMEILARFIQHEKWFTYVCNEARAIKIEINGYVALHKDEC